ncbi:hypothetical protein EI42_05972 [Thermosporothrix hazakensis]|uniref:Uncharacterized protein n=1 Tax=Thermosporothrix hazakensis TaxID=644383 RepID=A0A326TSU5_THEHA|nr:hypothetical protein EI42_05972 [Thermosporothrix hazakensis]GCE49225.1 hypothetical protein KTH_40940 [Thermosporothrix hazakensis]
MKSCALYRHGPFKTTQGVCLVCNPTVAPNELREILQNPILQAYYDALKSGTECAVLRCKNPGKHEDGLGHWWCEEHVSQCVFLIEGAKRGFPEWEYTRGHILHAGRPAWVKNAMKCDDIPQKAALLLGIPLDELRARYTSPQEAPEPEPAVLDLSMVAF